jgi:hypothetical protein
VAQQSVAVSRPKIGNPQPRRRRHGTIRHQTEVAMSLSPATRLGPYEITSPLGAGGMDSPLLVKRKDS